MEWAMRDYESYEPIPVTDDGARYTVYGVRDMAVEIRDGRMCFVLLVSLRHRYP